MSKSLVTIARITLAVGLAGAIVAGCGRKGDLDRPSTPLAEQNVRKDIGPGATKKQAPVPERPFLLDPLL